MRWPKGGGRGGAWRGGFDERAEKKKNSTWFFIFIFYSPYCLSLSLSLSFCMRNPSKKKKKTKQNNKTVKNLVRNELRRFSSFFLKKNVLFLFFTSLTVSWLFFFKLFILTSYLFFFSRKFWLRNPPSSCDESVIIKSPPRPPPHPPHEPIKENRTCPISLSLSLSLPLSLSFSFSFSLSLAALGGSLSVWLHFFLLIDSRYFDLLRLIAYFACKIAVVSLLSWIPSGAKIEQALKSVYVDKKEVRFLLGSSSGLIDGFIDPDRLVHVFLWGIVIILDLVACLPLKGPRGGV